MPLPSPQVLEAAATWHVDLLEAGEDEALQRAHRQWLEQHPQHRQAWARMQKLQQQVRALPDGSAATLRDARISRRQSIKALSLLLAGGVALQQGVQRQPGLFADYATTTGERFRVTLDDGGELLLNTASAVNVRYSSAIRELHLLQGEVHITTAQDKRSRPFIVHTAYGSVRALGTRFLVRSSRDYCTVTVLEHAVEVRTASSVQQASRVAAGQRLRFDNRQVLDVSDYAPAADAWTRGLLVASNWRLDDFIQELSRYHRGYIYHHPSIAALRISGAFQLADTRAVLENLSNTLPLELYFLSPYIVRIGPKKI